LLRIADFMSAFIWSRKLTVGSAGEFDLLRSCYEERLDEPRPPEVRPVVGVGARLDVRAARIVIREIFLSSRLRAAAALRLRTVVGFS